MELNWPAAAIAIALIVTVGAVACFAMYVKHRYSETPED
jgi:hypothetical protein